jgi:hypothetical protein
LPDFVEYHKSITSELDSVKNNIRNLVTHWLTDGEWKEAALRTVLRRHLPNGTVVGRGFIVEPEQSSTQIDVLVLKQGKPTLFRDGELTIVTPDVPGAIAEVKTRVQGGQGWYDVIKKLADHGVLCKRVAKNEPWLGVFAYEGGPAQVDNILDSLRQVHKETGIAVNCVTVGKDLFVRYWPAGEYEPGGDDVADARRTYWRAYELHLLSPSYFFSNLIDSVCNVDRTETGYAWFAYRDGKQTHMIAERSTWDSEPHVR